MKATPGTGWKGATIALYSLAATGGLIATVRSFDRDLDVSLVLWTFGMIAGFFACGLAVIAAAAFLRRDDDHADLQSFLGVVMFLVSAPVTTGSGGLIAAGLTLAAWMASRFLRSQHRRAWRDDFVERREFLSSLRRRDPREADGISFVPKPLLDSESEPRAEVRGADGDYATTRWELKRRAREVDQDPWGQPPG